jgi:hypothetical protein
MVGVLFIFVPFVLAFWNAGKTATSEMYLIPTTTIVTDFPSRGAHAGMLNVLVPRRIANRAVRLGSDPSPLLHGVEGAIALRDRRRLGHHHRHHRAPDAHEPIHAREQLGAHLDAVAAAGIERPHAWGPEPSEHHAGLDRVEVVAVETATHREVRSLDRSVTESEAHVGADLHVPAHKRS